MDNKIRQNYFEKLKNAITKTLGVSDMKKVHHMASMVENTGFNKSAGKPDAYINYIEGTMRALQGNKEEFMTANLGEQPGAMLQQLYQTLQGASSSPPLMGHQQPNNLSRPLMGNQQQNIQQPKIPTPVLRPNQQLNNPTQPLMGHPQLNSPTQPLMGHQQLNSPLMGYQQQKFGQGKNPSPLMGQEQLANNPSPPLMGHQQLPNNPSPPLIGHQRQPNNPSPPFMNNQKQPNNPKQPFLNHQKQPNNPSQPLLGRQQQQIQHPGMPSQPYMGQHQQPIPPNQQQIQGLNFQSKPSMGYQEQQKNQQPSLSHQQQQKNQQPSMTQKNQKPSMGHQQKQNNQQVLVGNQQQQKNQQPSMGHQQQQKNQQPLGGHQQQQKNQQPSVGHQQQQKNQQPLGGHQQQQKNQQPSMTQKNQKPSMGHQQKQNNQKVFVGNQQQQKNQRPTMVHQQQQKNQQPSMGHQQQQKNQQPSVGHQQQQKDQQPSVGNQQQQKNQQPSTAYQQQFQANSKGSKKTTPKPSLSRKPRGKNEQQPTNQHVQPPSNPPPFVPASQIPQYQGPPAFNPPIRPNNTQPHHPHQQQNAFPGNVPLLFHQQFQAPRPPHNQFPHPSQLRLPQNPQNKQLQQQQGLQNPNNSRMYNYQYQYPNHPQYNPSHLQQNQLSHPSLPRQEHNQGTSWQPKRARRNPQPRGKPQQKGVKRDSGRPAPPPVPQSSNKRSQQSSHTSQNVHNDEIAKNSVVGQADNQESKHTLLNAPNRDVPLIEIDKTEDLNNEKLEQTQSCTSILGPNAAKENMGSNEIDMKEDLNNAKEVQTCPSISIPAQDTAKRDMDSMEIDMKKDDIKELKNTQSPNSILVQGALEMELGPIKSDMKEASIDERSNRNVVTEVANQEGDSMRLDEKEVNKEELEKASSSASTPASGPAQYAANQDSCSTGLVNDAKPDISSWPDLTATQFEQYAAESSLERLVRQIKSMKPDTFRMAVKDIASTIEEHHCKVDENPSVEKERWLQKYSRFANAPEESSCRDKDILELVQEDIESGKPDTFRMAVKDIASTIEEHHCKVEENPSIEQETWLQKYSRFSNVPEESHSRDKDISELVQEEILAIRNKYFDVSFKISKDEEENHKAFMSINLESVTDADTKNGIYVNLSYLGISLDQEYRALCKSQPKMQIKPLHLLIPPNYPERSPIILEKYPESGQFSEDFSSQAIAKFIESVRCVDEPITLAKIADIWNSTTREVMVSYAELRGGGTFTSTYSKWIYCDNCPNECVTPTVGQKRLRDWEQLFEDD